MEVWNILLFATSSILVQINGNPQRATNYAELDDVPDSSNQNSDKCSKVFHEMIASATNDVQAINDTHLGLTLKKITHDFILCIFLNSENFAKIPQLAGIGNSPGNKNPESRRSSGNGIFTGASTSRARKPTRIKYQKLRCFDLNNALEDRIWRRVVEFVDEGYDNGNQGNYFVLMKMLLFDMSESVLGGDLLKGVKSTVNEALEPYAAKKIKLAPIPDNLVMEVGSRLRQNCTKVSDQYFVDIPACDIPDMTGMLKCVYYNVTGLTGLQSWLNDDLDTPPEYWEPFKIKLYADVNRLLYAIISSQALKIGAGTNSEFSNSETSNSYWRRIYKVRSSYVKCMNLARSELDRKGDYVDVLRVKRIDKCLKSADAESDDLVDFFMHENGVGPEIFAAMSALEHDVVVKLLKTQLEFYKELRPLGDFVLEQIDSGMLEPDDDALLDERSFAWNIVLEWETSPEADVEQRLVNLFEEAHLTDPNCPLDHLDEISADSILDNDCWRLAFEDLLIIESAVNAAGLSLQVVFYGEPILMNYIYIVDQELAAAKRRLRFLTPFLASHRADPVEEYLLMLRRMNDLNHLHDHPLTGYKRYYSGINKLTKA